MPTTILSDQTPGAPVLNNSAGSLYSVLKWALPQLGWSVAFDEPANFRAAFRNDPLDGTGLYLQVKDNPADHEWSGIAARVQGFHTMSAIDSGSGAWLNASARYWIKAKQSASTSYFIVGDNRAFFFLPRFDMGERARAVLFAGDYYSYSNTYAGGFVIFHSNIGTSNFDGGSDLPGIGAYANTAIRTNLDSSRTTFPGVLSVGADGLTVGADATVRSVPPVPRSDLSNQPGTIGPSPPSLVTGGVNARVVEIISGAEVVGHIPGLLNPMHDLRSSAQEDEVRSGVGGLDGYGDAIEVFVVGNHRASASWNGRAFISLEGWWSV